MELSKIVDLNPTVNLRAVDNVLIKNLVYINCCISRRDTNSKPKPILLTEEQFKASKTSKAINDVINGMQEAWARGIELEDYVNAMINVFNQVVLNNEDDLSKRFFSNDEEEVIEINGIKIKVDSKKPKAKTKETKVKEQDNLKDSIKKNLIETEENIDDLLGDL